MVTASRDCTARVWKQAPENASAPPLNIAMSSGMPRSARIASWSSLPAGRLGVRVGARLGTRLAELREHTGDVNSAAFSPNGQFIVTASRDHTARIWKVGDW